MSAEVVHASPLALAVISATLRMYCSLVIKMVLLASLVAGEFRSVAEGLSIEF